MPDPLPELGQLCPEEYFACGENRSCFIWSAGPDCLDGPCCTQRCAEGPTSNDLELDHPDCPESFPHCAFLDAVSDDGFCIAETHEAPREASA